jgi:hypothetical protein
MEPTSAGEWWQFRGNFAIGNTLYAVGATAGGKEGQVRWTIELPGRLGTPSIADVEGNGALQVVVACADGYVYGIGPAGPGEPAHRDRAGGSA